MSEGEETKALVPISEQSVDFYGDEIITALVDVEGRAVMYVPIQPICKYLGLAWSGQFERIQRDPVLAGEAQLIRVTRGYSGSGRGRPDNVCLPVEFLHGWLFGISASRVKPELRDKVITYQRDCYRVLWESFNAQVPATPQITALEQIRATALAVAQLAEQQIEMETRLTGRLDKAAEIFIGFDRRLKTLEKQISPATRISDDQAETISATVKALAELMNAKAPGKNHYQGIFSELYRRYGVSSYKNIRLEQYEKVLQFLEDWRKSNG